MLSVESFVHVGKSRRNCFHRTPNKSGLVDTVQHDLSAVLQWTLVLGTAGLLFVVE